MTEDVDFRQRVIDSNKSCDLRNIDVRAYSVTDSTNTRAREYALEHSPRRITVFVSDSQSAGRGRRGRSFDSPSGAGLYFSVLIPVRECALDFTELTVRGAVATRRAILEVSGIDTEIKWVNDILKDGKKTAGILAEAVTDSDSGRVEYAILGIGINIRERAFPEQLRDIAASLSEHTGQSVCRERLLSVILRELLLLPSFSSVIEEYRRHSATVGRTVEVYELSGERYTATALGICDTGALRVLLPSGEIRELSSAEVSVKINNKNL